jgi:nitrate reductase molybdenum cofactor assembly chaperone NarJ/NarW
MSYLTLCAISRLMAYPTEELKAALPEIRAVFEAEGLLDAEQVSRLVGLVDQLDQHSVLAQQERYVALFDRGRALSLHLFEHVHGESRDRGQAMVDLMELYQAAGLYLDAHELPDYLPLMLEYLSTRPREEIDALLGDAMGVIVLLGARLRERDSSYHVLFDALETIAGSPEEAAELRKTAATEGPDETIEKMDEIWAEEQVTFLGNSDPSGGCRAGNAPGGSTDAIPIRFSPAPARPAARNQG